MNQYTILKNRYAKFQRFSLRVCAISFVVFIIFNALNTGQRVLQIISVIAFYLFIATGVESIILTLLTKIIAAKENKS